MIPMELEALYARVKEFSTQFAQFDALKKLVSQQKVPKSELHKKLADDYHAESRLIITSLKREFDSLFEIEQKKPKNSNKELEHIFIIFLIIENAFLLNSELDRRIKDALSRELETLTKLVKKHFALIWEMFNTPFQVPQAGEGLSLHHAYTNFLVEPTVNAFQTQCDPQRSVIRADNFRADLSEQECFTAIQNFLALSLTSDDWDNYRIFVSIHNMFEMQRIETVEKILSDHIPLRMQQTVTNLYFQALYNRLFAGDSVQPSYQQYLPIAGAKQTQVKTSLSPMRPKRHVSSVPSVAENDSGIQAGRGVVVFDQAAVAAVVAQAVAAIPYTDKCLVCQNKWHTPPHNVAQFADCEGNCSPKHSICEECFTNKKGLFAKMTCRHDGCNIFFCNHCIANFKAQHEASCQFRPASPMAPTVPPRRAPSPVQLAPPVPPPRRLTVAGTPVAAGPPTVVPYAGSGSTSPNAAPPIPARRRVSTSAAAQQNRATVVVAGAAKPAPQLLLSTKVNFCCGCSMHKNKIPQGQLQAVCKQCDRIVCASCYFNLPDGGWGIPGHKCHQKKNALAEQDKARVNVATVVHKTLAALQQEPSQKIGASATEPRCCDKCIQERLDAADEAGSASALAPPVLRPGEGKFCDSCNQAICDKHFQLASGKWCGCYEDVTLKKPAATS